MTLYSIPVFVFETLLNFNQTEWSPACHYTRALFLCSRHSLFSFRQNGAPSVIIVEPFVCVRDTAYFLWNRMEYWVLLYSSSVFVIARLLFFNQTEWSHESPYTRTLCLFSGHCLFSIRQNGALSVIILDPCVCVRDIAYFLSERIEP